tara:strand:+ start:99 stop:668 length:570 start_codon:yes stop_codon:yes gene_type:complete
MTRTFPDMAIIGAAGESLVLSHLLRLNYVAGLAPYNTRDYDLIILNENENIAKSIQVKSALYTQEIKTTDLKWILKSKHETAVPNLIFFFVNMSMQTSKNEIYIMDSEKVAHVTKMSHQIYLKLPGMKGQPHKDSPMRILSSNYENSVTNKNNRDKLNEFLTKTELEFLNEYSDGWMDQYLDNWKILDK